MKNLLGVTVSMLFVLAGTPAMAIQQDPTCEIGFTGPNSQNMCESEATYLCEINNDNVVTIRNESEQEVFSGSVNLIGNTSSGNSSSGTVSNSNGTIFNVSVNNQVDEEESEGVCVAKLLTPPVVTPEKPVTPEVNPPEPSKEVKALPVSSGDNYIVTTLGLVAGGSLVVVAVGLCAVALRRNLYSK